MQYWSLNPFGSPRFDHEVDCKDKRHIFLMLLSSLYIQVIEAYSHALDAWGLSSDFEVHLPLPKSGS